MGFQKKLLDPRYFVQQLVFNEDKIQLFKFR